MRIQQKVIFITIGFSVYIEPPYALSELFRVFSVILQNGSAWENLLGKKSKSVSLQMRIITKGKARELLKPLPKPSPIRSAFSFFSRNYWNRMFPVNVSQSELLRHLGVEFQKKAKISWHRFDENSHDEQIVSWYIFLRNDTPCAILRNFANV